ncbi:hypothetical protein BLAT2472_20025 [Burkholderia latens]
MPGLAVAGGKVPGFGSVFSSKGICVWGVRLVEKWELSFSQHGVRNDSASNTGEQHVARPPEKV